MIKKKRVSFFFQNRLFSLTQMTRPSTRMWIYIDQGAAIICPKRAIALRIYTTWSGSSC